MWIHFECLESHSFFRAPSTCNLVISLKHEKQKEEIAFHTFCFLCTTYVRVYTQRILCGKENKLWFWHRIHTITICLLFVCFSKFPFETSTRRNGVKTIFSQLSTKITILSETMYLATYFSRFLSTYASFNKYVWSLTINVLLFNFNSILLIYRSKWLVYVTQIPNIAL